jgi:hypothetical protein
LGNVLKNPASHCGAGRIIDFVFVREKYHPRLCRQRIIIPIAMSVADIRLWHISNVSFSICFIVGRVIFFLKRKVTAKK